MSSDDPKTPDKQNQDSPKEKSSDAILPFGDKLDEIAQERFNRTDWIELVAAFLLAFATILAAWSAYQSTRWSGNQANASAEAGALRAEANRSSSIFGAQVGIDVQLWTLWLQQAQLEDQRGMDFVAERYRDEFKPAFDAWLALVPAGEPPPGTPFDLEEYAPEEQAKAAALIEEANVASQTARDANQTGDNFVLMAVIMASVLFFAGVGTKFKGRGVRLMMITVALVMFIGGLLVIFSLPQDIGI
ncbi:MAG: hypothetical protein ACC726_00110 [Chloroflexota bacterium]